MHVVLDVEMFCVCVFVSLFWIAGNCNGDVLAVLLLAG